MRGRAENMKGLLLKYIAGEANEEESARVEEWLAEDPEHFKTFEELWDLWYAVGTATNVFRFNTDAGWEAVLNEMKTREKQKKDRFFFKRVLIAGISVAAAALLVFGVFLFRKQQQTTVQESMAVNETAPAVVKQPVEKAAVSSTLSASFKTGPGERKKEVLPDGSIAWLNGNTSVSFKEDKQHEGRVLYLTGEAFFDVKRAASEPFIVKTAYATIQALGTRFDVTAYPKDSLTEAVLTGGRIVFNTDVAHRKESRQLVPGEKISVNHLSDQLKIIEVDTSFYASWTTGALLFRDETFGQVARAMERKYNVSFIFSDRELVSKRLSGYFEKESLQQALDALQLTLPFRYDIHDNEVIIGSK